MSIEYPQLDKADGSAIYRTAQTASLGMLSGPEASQHGDSQNLTLRVLLRPLSGQAGTKESSLGATIRSILEQSIIAEHLPRTVVHLVIQMLTPAIKNVNWSGEEQAAAINAGMLSLLDAGSIPLHGVICAVVHPNDMGGCLAYLFASDQSVMADEARLHHFTAPTAKLIYATRAAGRFTQSEGSFVDTEEGRKAATQVWRQIWKSKASTAEIHTEQERDNDDDMIIST